MCGVLMSSYYEPAPKLGFCCVGVLVFESFLQVFWYIEQPGYRWVLTAGCSVGCFEPRQFFVLAKRHFLYALKPFETVINCFFGAFMILWSCFVEFDGVRAVCDTDSSTIKRRGCLMCSVLAE